LIECVHVASMVSRSATGAPIWAVAEKLKSGASRRCSRDFKICWSSQRMETVLPRSVTTLCAESASHCTAGVVCPCSIRAQNALKFGGFRSPLATTRRSYGVGDFFQRFGSVPWHLEPMNKYLSRCQTAALGASMSRAWSVVAPQVHPFGRWRKLKSGASRRCSRDFKICWSSQRMETVLPRSCSIRAQNAPKFGGFQPSRAFI
jgi:hypothetical protein